MRKSMTIIMLITFISFAFTIIAPKTYAMGLDKLDNPDAYIDSSEDNSKIINIGNVVVWTVKTIGESIGIVMILIIGIRYLMGSTEERAEYKQSMIPYIIGAILIFSGAFVTQWIYDMFT